MRKKERKARKARQNKRKRGVPERIMNRKEYERKRESKNQ